MLVKQPNGKFAYINRNGNAFINLTIEDYKQMRINEFMEALDKELSGDTFSSIADLIQCVKLSDDAFKSMGCEMTRDEMMKYIPKTVLNTSYASRDFTTHGKCPTCRKSVQDGIGHKDEKCPNCNQRLKWD